MKIGYLGDVGAYSHEACMKYIESKKDSNIETYNYKTISETILKLDKGEIDEAVVPIENSIEGGVTETIDNLLTRDKLNIIDELTIEINHYLLSKCEKIEEINNIYSHPQAIAQCRNYIMNTLPNAITNEVSSTVAAARLCSINANMENKAACISSKACQALYGLNILAENVNDEKNNMTKFIVISKKENGTISKASNAYLDNTQNAPHFGGVIKHNKTSIVFGTKNKPGELYKVLGIFNAFNINLSKIESRPAKTRLGEYIFWIDFDGNKNEEKIKVLLKEVKSKATHFRILGSY